AQKVALRRALVVPALASGGAAGLADKAAGAGAHADILAALPVQEIVPGGAAGAGEVGDLVALVPGGAQGGAQGLAHRGLLVVAGEPQAAAAPGARHRHVLRQ